MSEDILKALTIIEEEENRTKKDIETIRKAKQEIERLNNIINELEKELKVDYEKYKNCDFESIIAQIDSYWLNRIKDLKELRGDKE